MKLTQNALAVAAILALFLGGQAMAGEDRTGSAASGETVAPCHDTTNVSATALPAEAPWISLAITNGKGIGLSQEQTRTLEKLRSDFQQLSKGQMKAIANAERELNQLLQGDPVKLSLVREQVDRIGALNNDLRQRRIETLLEGRTVLDAEQQEKLQELVARSAVEKHNTMMERYHGQARPPRGMM